MQRRPLPDDLGTGRGSSISSAAAPAKWSAVTLRMQLPLVWMQCISTVGELGEDIGHVDQLRPVELQILPRREMAVALVVFARDVRELAQLPRRQRAVGNGDAQHVGVKLQIEPVHQPQRLELVLGQFARQPARDLAAKLLDALVDEALVEFVIAIHRRVPPGAAWLAWACKGWACKGWACKGWACKGRGVGGPGTVATPRRPASCAAGGRR